MSTEMAVLKMAPHATRFAKPIEDTCIRRGIITPIDKAHFLATLAHETCGFTLVEEGLNYSAKGLRTTFGKYFTTDAMANAYARQPHRIANHVYANRGGNRNEASGDGWLFRGRGLIQNTFHDNYLAYSINRFNDDRLLRDPDLLTTPEFAADSAGWFWQKNNINALIDEDDIHNLLADNDDIKMVTRRVNGGYNGLEDRKRWLKLAKESLWVTSSSVA